MVCIAIPAVTATYGFAPTGPAALGHPWPSAGKPASMPVYPLRRTGTKPLDGARKSKAKARRGGLKADLIGSRTRSPCVIVPTLCVGMPPGTLRVPMTTHDVSRAQRWRGAWERSGQGLPEKSGRL